MQTLDMKYLRRVLGVTRRDNRNAAIREKLRMGSIIARPNSYDKNRKVINQVVWPLK